MGVYDSVFNWGSDFWFRVKIGVDEFFLSHSGELVDAHFVGLAFVSIVSVDLFNISLENNSSVFIFRCCPVGTILGFPLFESGVLVGLSGNVDGSDEESSQSKNSQAFVH
jgi:hypothetical protein